MNENTSYAGKYLGEWWIPEQEEDKLQGTLEIKADGESYIEFLGQFNSNTPIFRFENFSHLHGIAISVADNKCYSVFLFNFHPVNKISSRLIKHKYLALKVLIGKSSAPLSANYTELMLGSEIFGKWRKETGIGEKVRFEDEIIKDTSFTYRQPEPIDLFSNKNSDGYIFFRCSHSFRSKRRLKLVEQPFLNLRLHHPMEFIDLFKVCSSIERFFMVIWEQYHVFTDIYVRNENKSEYRLIGSRHVQFADDVFGFDYNDFKKNSERYYNNWIKVYEEFNLAIRTFFFAFADYKVDIYSRFLNYVFALEQLHRKGFRATEPLSKKDKKMYDMAMKIKQGDLKSWLASVLNKERDIPLTTRLKELCEFAELKEPKKISNEEITRIKNMRHYLVHLDEKHKKTAFTGREVCEINQKLESLFFTVLKKNMVEEKPWPSLSC